MSPAETLDRFRARADSAAPVPVEDAHALFDALEPVSCEDMIGAWDGGLVPTGHPGEQQLDASLRAVEHRGVVTATMVYDNHPVFDHFRRVDGATVLGLMDRKGEPAPLFFWLRRSA